MTKLIAVGKDNFFHVVDASDKRTSCCDNSMPIVQVNPDFTKVSARFWCYECSALLEKEEDHETE